MIKFSSLRTVIVGAIMLFFISGTFCFAQQPAVHYLEDLEGGAITKAQSDSIFQKVKKLSEETVISIGLITNGKARFYGVKRSGDTIKTVSNSGAVFEIGSISKVFTATMLAHLVEEGRIALDDTINEHLEVPFHNNQQITFLSLSNHTSGLPRLPTNLTMRFEHRNNPYANYDEVMLKNYLRDTMELAEKQEMSYSNLGVGLLGYTLGEIAGSSYQQLADSLIFRTYGMRHTTTDRAAIEDRLVLGRNGGVVVPNWDLAVLMGAGGILSNVEDLSKFIIAQFDEDNAVLALTRTKTKTLEEGKGVGLGWFLLPQPSDALWYFHNGGTGGYRSALLMDVAHKNGIVVLSNVSANRSNSDAIDALAFALMKTLKTE